MKRIIILSLLTSCLLSEGIGQTSISLDVGLSFMPVVFQAPQSTVEDKTLDLLLGISGMATLSEKWSLHSSISYANRTSLSWVVCGFATCENHSYKYNELSLGVHALRKINKRIHLGLGPTAIRGLNVRYSIVEDGNNQGEEYLLNYNHFGLNALATVNIWMVNIRMSYTRRIINGDSLIPNESSNLNIYNLAVEIPLFPWQGNK